MQSTPSKRYQYLQFEDRVTLLNSAQQKYSVRVMVQVLRLFPNTICRELRCNAQHSCFASAPALICALLRREQSRQPIKLHPDDILFGLMRYFLDQHWSPEQIVMTLARIFPKEHEPRASPETIYNCICAQPAGGLKRELMATLRHAHNKRVPRCKSQDQHDQTPEMMRIHVRPPEIADRQFSDHWEGDLIKSADNTIAAGSLVGRTSGLFMLIKLPECKPSSRANALQAFSDKLLVITEPMLLRMTMTQGREMTMHKGLRKRTSIVRCTSVTRTDRGSLTPTRTPTGWFGSTCPRILISRAMAKLHLIPLPTRSTTGPSKAWTYDHPWRSVYRELLLNTPQPSTLVH